MDFQGPSMAVDTACSSSLTAIHLAMESLYSGMSDCVIAGGVNLNLHPAHFLGLSEMTMLSPTNTCKAFGDHADGFVDGEGVGAIVLKPLHKAIAERDHIYGIIKGGMLNAGGKTSGFTVPNPNAQFQLISETLDRAGVHPRTVSYIETHGTGTVLGDPIEISGLTKAFEQDSEDKQFCAIGSVKSNIGHCESAAGIAGVTKVLLQLRHTQLAPSLHSKVLNPNIDFHNTPFVVQQKLEDWKRPVLTIEGKTKEYPRIAGVSSFGAGGSNAHVVIEEYVEKTERERQKTESGDPYLIVLSAKNEDRLKEYAEKLLEFVQRESSILPEMENFPADLSYTLQVGREAMDARLGIIVGSIHELEEKLKGFMDGRDDVEDLYRGQVKRTRETLDVITADEDMVKAIDTWIRKRKYAKLLNLWVKGLTFDWDRLYSETTRPCRISLPTYPFARERYWMTETTLGLPYHHPHLRKDTSGSMQQPPVHQSDDLTYIPKWEEQDRLVPGKEETPHQVVLIVYSESSSRFEETLLDHYVLNHPETKVIQIQSGHQTKQLSDNKWSCDLEDPKGFEQCLRDHASVDCLYFISAYQGEIKPVDPEGLMKSQQANEIQLFRLIKTLKPKIGPNAFIDCYLLTMDNYRVIGTSTNPHGGGITGLAYSIAQGDHRFLVRNIDMSREDFINPERQNALLRMILDESASDRGDATKIKSGTRYKQGFIKLDLGEISNESGLKSGGVYVILGGSGTVGSVMTRYLIQEYKARVVWIGRQPETSPMVQEKLAPFHGSGETLLYIQADATQLDSMKEAVKKIKREYSTINGAIFSGLVLNINNSLDQTTEAEFQEVLDIKTKGSINFYTAFKEESLDFMCYFSSIQAFSFLSSTDSAGYASGITFSDAFVKSIQQNSPFPVGIINWGYWEASIIGTEIEKRLSNYFGFISDYDGFQFFKKAASLIQRGILRDQILCLRASERIKKLMNCNEEEVVSISEQESTSFIQSLCKDKKEEAKIPVKSDHSDEFDEWIGKLLFVQMRQLGIFSQRGVSEESATLRKKAGVIAKYDRWWQECCLGILETRGYVECEGRQVKVSGEIGTEEAEGASDPFKGIWKDWELYKEPLLNNPEKKAQVELADSCLRKLPEILRGTIQATDILFPGSSLEKVENLYKNAIFDYFNAIMAEVLRTYMEQRIEADPRVRVRIIEIGAGTGGTTAIVLPELQPFQDHIEEYCYTDISRAFLVHGEENYGPGCPFLKYKHFNIEQPLADQGIEIGTYDIAIAANVLHATKNIRKTLRNAKATLKRNGILLLNEVVQKKLLATVTLGLLDGWWLYEDESLRIPGSPLINIETWLKVLEEEGFGSILFPARAAMELGQQIIVAESDGVVRQKIMSNVIQVQDSKPVISHLQIPEKPAEDLREFVATLIRESLFQSLRMSVDEIDHTIPFSDYGLDSILGVDFVKRVNDALGITMNTATIFDYTTVDRLTNYVMDTYRDQIAETRSVTALASAAPPLSVSTDLNHTKKDPFNISEEPSAIAVIGMSGQFPGARDVNTFWQNLIEGLDGVSELPASYLSSTDQSEKINYKWGGILEERDCFDPLFFNISPREAESMNPHQRLILQECWKGLEDAGYNPKSLENSQVGIFIGAEPARYFHKSFTGASDAIIASRLSYYLNLRGPAIVVNTGCSSSGVAIHLACQSLAQGESTIGIAGGVFAMMSQGELSPLADSGMLSPTGQCHPFDESENGTVLSEGVAVVVLKRLNDAIEAGDPIYGIIQGSGMNQDGASNGITAPNGVAQEALITDIYQRYKINPEEITHIEVHGTGTKLGDPVEANALVRAFKKFTGKKHYCAIGSAKSNIGHTSASSGVIGLIKVLLSLQHHKLPGLLHFKQLNPLIEFEDSPFYINTQLSEWRSNNNKPLMAGLNSFGHSGTNVHIVVKEYEKKAETKRKGTEPYLIVLSARDEDRLREYASRLLEFIRSGPPDELNLANIAYTLQTGREAMTERLLFIVRDAAELIDKLQGFIEGKKGIKHCWQGHIVENKSMFHLFGSDEDTKEMVSKWIEKGKFNKMAEVWIQGAALDWNLLYGEVKPDRIHLPTYPFAKERYWAPEKDRKTGGVIPPDSAIANVETVPDKTPISAVEESFELMCFEEVWQERVMAKFASTDRTDPPVKTLVCFLSNPENQGVFIDTIKTFSPQTRTIFIGQGPGYERRSSQNYQVSTGDPETYRKAFHDIREGVGRIDGLLYLWALEDLLRIRDYSPIVNILQASASTRLVAKRYLLAGEFKDGLDRCYLESWIGFERSLRLVLPDSQVVAILQEVREGESEHKIGDWTGKLWEALIKEKVESILYRQGKGHELRINSTQIKSGKSLVRSGGTILITGGCGGLGLLFAEHLARTHQVNLVLTGRSPLTRERQSRIQALEDSGSPVFYLQADVCDLRGMKEGLKAVKERFPKIHGVIHAAGIQGDRTIFDKGLQDFQKVMDPKVKGSLILDEALAEEPLDFICYFSSSSAILGDIGSCDYAIGNRFQMAYARYRNKLQGQGKPFPGKAIVINWPLWRDGGMRFSDNDQTQFYLKSSGQRFLEVRVGLRIFEQLLSQDRTQHLVMVGQPSRVHRFLGLTQGPAALNRAPNLRAERRPEMRGLSVEQCVRWDLKELMSQLLKISRDKLDGKNNLADFGFDSISLADFARSLSKHYGIEITPAIFFGYSTLDKLIDFFISEHLEMVQSFYQDKAEPQRILPCKPEVAHTPIKTISSSNRDKNLMEPIAIIGMSGRFPQARNIEEMWEILLKGKDVVQEIPKDRFDWRDYYGDSSQDPNKTNYKWFGYIPGVAEFDPLFFDISPREAETMDPRQRHLLQESWKALEDAGYGATQIENNKIGMFVGAEDGDYRLLSKEGSITSNNNAILASRLAYFLNLKGPAMAINTACSSSLVAAHQACMSLRCHECDTAIVAGVNLMVTPVPFVTMAQAGMLSPDGKCYAFDKRANGMVPGEAIAVVVLKRLSRAESEGDPIHALILGSGINYDGKTNGITAPSGVSQTILLKDVYEQYQINPEEIEYIVTHGTGTKLGDPVEINALYDAFKETTRRQGYCALTSTKTNFGHTFAASGLASLIGLVQALRHEEIPASLHCEEENNYINWKESPFYVNKTRRSWPKHPEKERIGAVSAFGMSGTNAHMVVQGYCPEKGSVSEPAPYYLLVLSAKTEDALKEKIRDMVSALQKDEAKEQDLSLISCTLLEGRHHFQHRCAIVVQDVEDALYVLQQVGKEKRPNIFKGKVPREFTARKAIQQYVKDLSEQSRSGFFSEPKKYQEILYVLADFYCMGYDIPRQTLENVTRIHLPTYPFARDHYWVEISGADNRNDRLGLRLDDVKGPSESKNQRREGSLDPSQTGLILMSPVWNIATREEKNPLFPVPSSQVVIVGGTEEQRTTIKEIYSNAQPLEILPQDTIEMIATQLKAMGTLNHIVWIAPDRPLKSLVDEALVQEQTQGVIQVFRLVKALLSLGYGRKDLGWTLITTQTQAIGKDDPVNPTHVGIHGFTGSMAKEYPDWKIRLLDLEAGCDWPAREIFALPANPQGNALVYRGREWFQQSLIPIRDIPVNQTLYREKGVYVVIGGAGGIGEAWTRYMIEKYQAQIIWIGRRKKDSEIQGKLDLLSGSGPVPHYIAADATNQDVLERAYEEIKQSHPQIHGVIHSALGLYDQSLMEMDEERFRNILSVKIDASVRIAQVFQKEPLDFILFFSTIVAFGKGEGMSGYSAGCNFMDAFALQLGKVWPCKVKVMNWGYWSIGGGDRISRAMKSRLEQSGVRHIEPEEGIDALERLLTGPVDQLALMKTLKASGIMNSDEWMMTYPETIPSCIKGIQRHLPKQKAPDKTTSPEELDGWIIRLLFAQMRALGIFQRNMSVEIETLRKKAGILDKYDFWWRECLTLLETSRYIHIEAGQVMVSEDIEFEEKEAIWREWDAKKELYLKDQNLCFWAIILDDCFRNLPQILKGEILVTDILFPNGSMEKMEGLYKNNTLVDYFNRVVAEVARAYIKQRIEADPQTLIRVIEIGAGTGGTTSMVLPKLHPYQDNIKEYCYTDLSKSFLIHGKEHYGPKYSYLEYKLWNVEEPLEDQDIESGGYDIAVATNVLHATKSIRNTLRNAKAALAKNGILILNEISKKTVYETLIFGLIDGWSLSEDNALRIPGSPGLYSETWHKVLEEERFRSILFPVEDDHNLGLQIVVAESDGVIRQKIVNETITPSTSEVSAESLKEYVEGLILDSLSQSLKIDKESIEKNVPFSDYGIDSILGVNFINQVNNGLEITLNTTTIFDYTTVDRLTNYVMDNYKDLTFIPNPAQNKIITSQQPKASSKEDSFRITEERSDSSRSLEIAVIGMSGQFPDAKDVNTFWQNLIEGHNGVRQLPSHYLDQRPGRKNYQWGGFLEERDCFDPLFFNISPREAASMNPHQRLILQESWKGLEDAGYNPKGLTDSQTAIFIGAEPTGYFHETFTGASEAIIASRLSYYLNLKGPAIVVNTGCSSSGVAIYLACESLRNKGSNIALAGGVSAAMGQKVLSPLSETEMLSPTGQCNTFDASANGMVLSEGVGIVVLKRFEDAINDGDHIYGIIKGSGMNQDGASNGITAPNGLAQEELITDVYRRYNINPEDISYIEAHGTGTTLGDPVEGNALVRAFKQFTNKKHYCAVGSAKAFIGHTGANATVTGLIKILLSLQNHKIPGLLHFNKLNPLIEFDDSPFFVNTELLEWPSKNDKLLMAAINSFGHSGTNVHLVVKEYIPPQKAQESPMLPGKAVLIPFSAKNEERLKAYVHAMLEYVSAISEEEIENMAYTLQVGREAMEERVIFMVRDISELIEKLHDFTQGKKSIEHCWKGRVYGNKIHLFASDEDTQDMVSKWIVKGKLKRVAELWTQGVTMDWDLFYGEIKPPRMSLPTYPFAKESYWMPTASEQLNEPSSAGMVQEDVAPAEITGTLMCQPVWIEKEVPKEAFSPVYSDHVVMLYEMTMENPGLSFINLRSEESDLEKRYQDIAIQAFEGIKGIFEKKTGGNILIQILITSQVEQQLFSGLSGLLKTAHLENPKVFGQLIEVQGKKDERLFLEKLKENSQCPEDTHIRYQENKRQIASWKEIPGNTGHIPWKDNGIYLITGGIGGLGLIFAREIAEKATDPILILTGRSSLNRDKRDQLKALESSGCRIEYRQADVSHKKEVNVLIQGIEKDFGQINGILHSAGVIQDNFILKKTSEEFKSVLTPKVSGTVYLDQATMNMNLDFFVLFSSTSGALGNPGQADYATANAFMDAYAKYRNDLVTVKERQGQTLSINWPLWKEGGMGLDEATETMIKARTGMIAMRTSTGIQAFHHALASAQGQIMVIEGHLPVTKQWLFESKTGLHPTRTSTFPLDEKVLKEKTLYQFKRFLGKTINLSADRIDSGQPLESYGIDSIVITQLNQRLETIFGPISKTLFFEHQTLDTLVDYFISEYTQKCAAWTGLDEKAPFSSETHLETVTLTDAPPVITQLKSEKTDPPVKKKPGPRVQESIAIIGISGHYAQADTLEKYWENLKAGKDCITEIPQDRWPLDGFYHEDPDEAIAQGKSYSKWGSFLEDFAQFDPLFFNISPKEAMNMDPQERLFLQCSWEVLEDAGYTKETLMQDYQQRVGVFAGITKTGFNLYGPEFWKRGESIHPYTSFSSVANRISYILNLQGPSMPIDTMCSSSLTAIHEACEHLRHGECELAIAGGVNLYLHPSTYIGMCAMKMVAVDEKCKSFGKGGNGFVPGEGVGAVLLKPLSRAIQDQDHIYAVVIGTKVNHSGKTNGYTVPNPKAQGQLIRDTLEKAGVHARAISYIEAHGTGTELGDPIEITGLTQAFQRDTIDTGFCSIGSAKSNLGHLEAAAGIAGLTKVILQMKHGQIAPSLHARELNPNIDFGETPFVLQQRLGEWKRPVIEINGELKEYPRIAGISSFGAGGSNAHVVIEEYVKTDEDLPEEYGKGEREEHFLIVLSAKNEERLKKYAGKLLAFIQRDSLDEIDSPGTEKVRQISRRALEINLENLAYTLQTGREAMEERLGLIIGSVRELEEKLIGFIEDREDLEGLYRGQVKRNRETLAVFTADEELREAIDKWIQRRKYSKLVSLWVKGLIVDWNKLYGQRKPHRISLPTYPFAKERYWLDTHRVNDSVDVGLPERFMEKYAFGKEFHSSLLDRLVSDEIDVGQAIKIIRKSLRE